MATIDFVGLPFPIDLPAFQNDASLLKKIKQLESLIELKFDMDDAKDALNAWNNSMLMEDDVTLCNKFKCSPYRISECILSYIVMLYAKAFRSSRSRTTLESKVWMIFDKDIEKHNAIMKLRDDFFAHHRIEANKHQLFYFRNDTGDENIKLNPFGQTSRMIISLNINYGLFEFCIEKVSNYLIKAVADLCSAIVKNLTDEQFKTLNNTPRNELFENHWRESFPKRIDPFSKRD